MKYEYGILLILVAFQPAPHAAFASPQAPSKAERDAALRVQGLEDQIASMWERIQDLDDDRKDAERQVDEAENQAAIADGASGSQDQAAGASARATASAARQRAANLRSRVRSDSDEILSLTRQIQELKYAEEADGAPRRDSKPASSSEPLVGTWKLNVARSTFASDSPKSETREVDSTKGGIKSVNTKIFAGGRMVRFEWTAKYDGKDYPIKGDGMRTIAIFRASDHFFNFKIKENGRVVTTGQIVCSPDLKSETMTGTVTDASGAQKQFVTFWDRQP
jgi:hypothetical protein